MERTNGRTGTRGEKEQRTKSKDKKQPHPATFSPGEENSKRKLTFKEKQEFESLEKEIPQLEKEKAELENLLASGNLTSDEIITTSQRHGELNDLIDEKTMRWLELSEI